MSERRIKILYIVGNGRSGSTLLNTILGQLDGYFAVGELRRVWDRAIQENSLCGCGVPFRDCPRWRAIFEEAFAGMSLARAREMTSYRDQLTQTKHLPGMLWRRRLVPGREQKIFVETLAALYRAVQHVTGCRVIVDASKWPMYAFMLDQIPGLDIYFLHLTRDPRAVAFSWSRIKERAPGELMPRQSALRSTHYWLAWNPAISYLWGRRRGRYFFLPYEYFAGNGRDAVAQIVRWIGEPVGLRPFIDENRVRLSETHSVAGNEARLARDVLALRLDDEWRRGLPRRQKWLVTGLSWLFWNRYVTHAPFAQETTWAIAHHEE